MEFHPPILKTQSGRLDVLGLTPEDWIDNVPGLGRTRARRLFQGLHRSPVQSLDEIPEVGSRWRQKIDGQDPVLSPLRPQETLVQPEDGETKKFVFLTQDDLPVESVLMPRAVGGFTACLSSQVGCRVGCTFCRTGEMGLTRNLSLGEIVDQLRWIHDLVQDQVRNVVFMGMGEPMENLEAVLQAIEVFRKAEVYGVSATRITISTSGHLPGIRRLAEANPKVHLAISLNAPNDALRDQIMPINRRYPLAKLRRELERYPLRPSQTFMIEYVLLAGVNDQPEHALALREWLEGLPVKLNLIPYNPVPGQPYQRPTPEAVQKFREVLGSVGQGVLCRYSWGRGIQAACGQLGSEILSKRRPQELLPSPEPGRWIPV